MGTRAASSLNVVAAAFLLIAIFCAPASAEIRTYTARKQIDVGPYAVKQGVVSMPTPAAEGLIPRGQDGAITHMEVDVVNEDGSSVPISRLMLHHVVFLNYGEKLLDSLEKDPTCDQFTMFDSQSKLPALAERFYAAGEERATLAFPDGYGYRVSQRDNWLMLYMLMNHKSKADTAFVQYRATYATGAEAAGYRFAKLLWLDVRNCSADPVYDVAGGGSAKKPDIQTYEYKLPEAGRLVSGMGHLHGGGQRLALKQKDCNNRAVFTSKPTWGKASHPVYKVKPVLHEPGPINMSGFTSDPGIPVAAGQTISMDSVYDATLPHSRVMGIMGLMYVPDPSVTAQIACGAIAALAEIRGPVVGRSSAPRFKVGLVTKPKGKPRRVKKVRVTGEYFPVGKILLHQGDRLTWQFDTDSPAEFGIGTLDSLHNVTLANGPEGFSSPNLDQGRTFTKKFNKPGKYELFCGLHPVSMTQEIVVKPKRKKK